MTQEQVEKARKARMTFERWADAEKLTAEQRKRLSGAEQRTIVPLAIDAMKYDDLATKIADAEARIEAWKAAQAEYVYAVETLADMRAKACGE